MQPAKIDFNQQKKIYIQAKKITMTNKYTQLRKLNIKPTEMKQKHQYMYNRLR